MTIVLSLLVCIVGALSYAISGNAKVSELGRLAFACGLLAFLLRFSQETLSVLR